MNLKKTSVLFSNSFCILLLSYSSFVSAELTVSEDAQAVVDTTTKLMWVSDANLAATESFGVTGIYDGGTMELHTAKQWIAAMNAENYLGYNDWTLGSSKQCSSESCNNSDLQTLWTKIKNSPDEKAKFHNINFNYWISDQFTATDVVTFGIIKYPYEYEFAWTLLYDGTTSKGIIRIKEFAFIKGFELSTNMHVWPVRVVPCGES